MSARVLVVDHEIARWQSISAELRAEGYDVSLTSSTEGALAIASQGGVDVAVVDLMMPGACGLEIARRLRSAHPNLVVLLAGPYPLSERQLARVDCAGIRFVSKPLQPSTIIAALRIAEQSILPPVPSRTTELVARA